MGKEDANKPMSIVNDNMSDTPETDAQGWGNGLHPWVATDFARKLERERDEAITRRMETIMQCELYEQERDEAREDLREIKEYGTEEINAAVELRQKLSQALIERDEARENCKSIVDKANELIARWDQPSWKDTAPTAGFIYALRDAVEAYEKKKP